LSHRFSFFLFFLFSFCAASFAQQTDSAKQITPDSVTGVSDTSSLVIDTTGIKDSASSILIDSNLNNIDSSKFQIDSTRLKIKGASKFILHPKKFDGEELLFYFLIGLLVFYAGLRLLFPKYFTDLFRVYFRTTLKQTQVREQLLQNPLPSLFLNGFFVVTGGLYACFILRYFNVAADLGFWELWLYSSFLLSVIYMIKFAGVKLAGWLFNKNEAATSYIFIVFMTNKILGIVVLPFLVLLAFSPEKIYIVTVVLSIALVSCIFLYRSYLSIAVVRNQVRINPLHFLLYLIAFEIIPLLILFKLVMNFLK
jgi:hypothetical protein